MIKSCIKCGAKYTQSFDFCPKCGGALEIDPDWLEEENQRKKKAEDEARRRDEYQRKQSELRDKMSQLMRIIPKLFVIDGQLFDSSWVTKFHYDDTVLGPLEAVAKRFKISNDEALAKLNNLADMLSGKNIIDMYAAKNDLRKEVDKCRDLIRGKSLSNEVRYFVEGGRYKEVQRLCSADYDVIPGTEKRVNDPWSGCTLEARGYVTYTYEVFEYDGSLDTRCERLIGYSSNPEALQKYFMLKKIIILLEQYLQDNASRYYDRFVSEVNNKAPELKVKRLQDESIRKGPCDISYYRDKGWR